MAAHGSGDIYLLFFVAVVSVKALSMADMQNDIFDDASREMRSNGNYNLRSDWVKGPPGDYSLESIPMTRSMSPWKTHFYHNYNLDRFQKRTNPTETKKTKYNVMKGRWLGRRDFDAPADDDDDIIPQYHRSNYIRKRRNAEPIQKTSNLLGTGIYTRPATNKNVLPSITVKRNDIESERHCADMLQQNNRNFDKKNSQDITQLKRKCTLTFNLTSTPTVKGSNLTNATARDAPKHTIKRSPLNAEYKNSESGVNRVDKFEGKIAEDPKVFLKRWTPKTKFDRYLGASGIGKREPMTFPYKFSPDSLEKRGLSPRRHTYDPMWERMGIGKRTQDQLDVNKRKRPKYDPGWKFIGLGKRDEFDPAIQNLHSSATNPYLGILALSNLTDFFSNLKKELRSDSKENPLSVKVAAEEETKSYDLPKVRSMVYVRDRKPSVKFGSQPRSIYDPAWRLTGLGK